MPSESGVSESGENQSEESENESGVNARHQRDAAIPTSPATTSRLASTPGRIPLRDQSAGEPLSMATSDGTRGLEEPPPQTQAP
ncbi:MAG: hypothetical protein R2735_06070 [Microthrixaceae bacterium]